MTWGFLKTQQKLSLMSLLPLEGFLVDSEMHFYIT